jgi:hypothetical protein
VWENAAIAALLAKAGAGESEAAADLSLAALDAANAALRRRLIAAHAAAEKRGDQALQTEILALYVEMAAARRLQLGG